MSELGWLTARPIAHRGLHDASEGIIENTGPAVEAAIAAGYGVEVDVRAAGDGSVVVFHDATLDRLTKEGGPVSARNAAALKKVAFRDTDARMLSLPDLLDLVAGKVPLVIEVKTQWDDNDQLERAIALALQRYDGPVAVMSFDPRSLLRFIRHAPDIPRGIVAERFRASAQWSQLSAWRRFTMRHLLHGSATQPHFVAYDIRGLPSAAPLIARYIFGLPLLTWTVRTKTERMKARIMADAMIFEGFRP